MASKKTLDDWLTWQETLMEETIVLGLERVQLVYEKLFPNGLPYTVITVAGTNGKGSTVSFIDSIYRQSTYKVGRSTSPHLLKYNERYAIDGEDVSDEVIINAFELIEAKIQADAPIAHYEKLPVQKGVGRFGPFIKWNDMFINVNKKYDWDDLSDNDIETLIKDKIQKEIDKLIHDWEEDGIRVEKARWGRHNIIQGKTKIELPKTVDATKLTLEEVKGIIAKNAPKKKTRAKKKK